MTPTLELLEEKQKTEEKLPTRRVCFVCTGNTCRSPMAAAVANAIANEPFEKLPESVRECMTPALEAYSRGLAAHEGDPIAENAVRALEEAAVPTVKGKDYHVHSAKNLTEEEAESMDLIIGMTGRHAFSLLMAYPACAKKIVSFPEDITDPYGGDPETYRKCLKEITDGVRKLLFPGTEEKKADGNGKS